MWIFVVLLSIFWFVMLLTLNIYTSKLEKLKLKNVELENYSRRLGAAYNTILLENGIYKQQMKISTSNPLPDKLVKDLIVFCHPDKHGGSEKASRLTQELLKLRK